MIETERADDHLLQLFSRAFLRDPLEQAPLLTEAERGIVGELFRDIQQFKQDPQAYLRYADLQEVAMSMKQFVDTVWEAADPEFRARLMGHFSPEERLKGLPAEERLKGLPAEDLIKGLSREQRARLRSLLDEKAAPTRKPRPARRKSPVRR